MKLKVGSKKALFFVLILGIILGIMVGAILIYLNKADKENVYMELSELVSNLDNSEEVIVDNEAIDDSTLDNDNEEKIKLVPTVLDEISNDTAYCPTFQIVWNEMLDFFCEGNKVEMLNGTLPLIDNLNERTFEKEDLSEEYYYVKVGKAVLSVKKDIEDSIKKKFNENSKVLDNIFWVDDSDKNFDIETFEDYVFYSMLKREFEFIEPFDVLKEGTFKDYTNVKYFGINSESDSKLREGVNVLFYNKDEVNNNYAVLLNTKQNDEVILMKANDNQNFKNFDEVYSYLENNTKEFSGDKVFSSSDNLRIPNLKFEVLKEYNELKEKRFLSSEGKEREISEALQTIEFEIDNKGGRIKSEAVMLVKTMSATINKRFFNFEDTYYLFLREKGKDKPYFILRVDDISLYQEGVGK